MTRMRRTSPQAALCRVLFSTTEAHGIIYSLSFEAFAGRLLEDGLTGGRQDTREADCIGAILSHDVCRSRQL